VGNASANTLTGGGGNDSFFFLNSSLLDSGTQSTDFSSWAVDTIADFTTGDDAMVFTKTSFNNSNAPTSGTIDSGEFVTGSSVDANSATGSTIFMYDTDSGNLFYDADGASGSGIHIATLTDHPDAVDYLDFHFIA
jgi:serralysin